MSKIPIQKAFRKREGQYEDLRKLGRAHWEVLAQFKGSKLAETLATYFETRRRSLLEELMTLSFYPGDKKEQTLFELQNIQSKLTEHLHLIALFEVANEMLAEDEKTGNPT